MLNCIRMDLYRMFHTKSFYVIGIIIIAAVIFTTSMSVIDYRLMQEEAETETQRIPEGSQEPVNLGMDVTIPLEPGDTVTVYDQVYANLRGKFIALFLVIYAVLFSTADISSGFVKNIGGQLKDRGKLILSKAAVLFVYVVLMMGLYLAVQTAAQGVFYRSLEIGPAEDLAVYMLLQTLLHYALVLICMAVSVILRSHVFSMTFAVLLCMNVMTILYSAADQLLERLGLEDVSLVRHTVTGKIALLDMAPSGKECMAAAATAVLFGTAAAILSSQIFRKRDV